MSFTRPTVSTIYGRMKADLEERLGNTNWFSRSLALILLAVFAGAIYLCYGFLIRLSEQFFFTKASTEFLDWHARLYGLTRKAAGYASKSIEFTGTNGKVIEEGTRVKADITSFRSTVQIQFETTEEVTIASGVAEATIQAVESGTDSNCEVDTVSLINPIDGVDTAATVLEDLEAGTDQETNDELIVRLLQRTQNPPGSGNKRDYERWALEVDGVERAWGLGAEEWLGVGTCGVILANSTLEPVGSTILADAVEYIDTKRPVGADVDVRDVTNKNVSIIVSITPNTEETQADIGEALAEVFIVDAYPGGEMLLSHIRKAISNAGIDDFEITDIEVDSVSVGVIDLVNTGVNVFRFYSATYSELT